MLFDVWVTLICSELGYVIQSETGKKFEQFVLLVNTALACGKRLCKNYITEETNERGEASRYI